MLHIVLHVFTLQPIFDAILQNKTDRGQAKKVFGLICAVVALVLAFEVHYFLASKEKNYYEILQSKITDPKETIHARFEQLEREYVLKAGQDGHIVREENPEEADEELLKLRQAYKILSNPTTRLDYDRFHSISVTIQNEDPRHKNIDKDMFDARTLTSLGFYIPMILLALIFNNQNKKKAKQWVTALVIVFSYLEVIMKMQPHNAYIEKIGTIFPESFTIYERCELIHIMFCGLYNILMSYGFFYLEATETDKYRYLEEIIKKQDTIVDHLTYKVLSRPPTSNANRSRVVGSAENTELSNNEFTDSNTGQQVNASDEDMKFLADAINDVNQETQKVITQGIVGTPKPASKIGKILQFGMFALFIYFSVKNSFGETEGEIPKQAPTRRPRQY